MIQFVRCLSTTKTFERVGILADYAVVASLLHRFLKKSRNSRSGADCSCIISRNCTVCSFIPSLCSNNANAIPLSPLECSIFRWPRDFKPSATAFRPVECRLSSVHRKYPNQSRGHLLPWLQLGFLLWVCRWQLSFQPCHRHLHDNRYVNPEEFCSACLLFTRTPTSSQDMVGPPHMDHSLWQLRRFDIAPICVVGAEFCSGTVEGRS